MSKFKCPKCKGKLVMSKFLYNTYVCFNCSKMYNKKNLSAILDNETSGEKTDTKTN